MLSGCGLGKKEVVENNKNSKIIFEKSKPITKELNPNLKIKLTKLTKGEVFLGNNTNNVGENNVVVGRQALYRNDGHNNVFGNIAIGYQAGTGNQSGDYNINIGYNSTHYYSN